MTRPTPADRTRRRTYYDLLQVSPKATAHEVEARFRRMIARYRQVATAEQLFNDPRFLELINAYLTLTGPYRPVYDAWIAEGGAATSARPAAPLDDLPQDDRLLLMARISFWRREYAETLHQLRRLLGRRPEVVEGWTLLGELHFTVNRLSDGIEAYRKASALDPGDVEILERLQHALEAESGVVELQVERSPEEEILREERRKRLKLTIAIGSGGVLLLAASFLRLVPGWLGVPWLAVFLQAGAAAVLLFALAFGRFLQPFEQVMVWSTVGAMDRSRARNYPYGLIFLVCSIPSLWLGVVTLVVFGLMDEEWPWSATIMFGICVMMNLLLVTTLHLAAHHPATSTFFCGGNLLVLAAMIGWWAGSIGADDVV